MKKFRVGIIGATGMVGQRFVLLLAGHPWFEVGILAASARSTGKRYSEAVQNKWAMQSPIPEKIASMPVFDAQSDMQDIAKSVDFVFCAVDMNKEQIKKLEESYAKLECPVISNNSAHRNTKDVPMIIPEINPEHSEIIPYQRKRLKTKRGFIAVKSNCSLQSYLPALAPVMKEFKVSKVLACTYQAISGAGKTFSSWPEMVDNVVPYIPGEEEKSEQEPLKILGKIQGDVIQPAVSPSITTQCLRVPVLDGHMAAVFVSFEQKPSIEQIKRIWESFQGVPQQKNLPMAPKKLFYYFEQPERPQPRLDRNLENGMAISLGRLREDSQYDYKFVCLSHNTLRGAAGGAVLMAELLAEKGYFD